MIELSRERVEKMIRNLGYACINEHLKPRTFRQCRLKSIYKYGIEYQRGKILENLSLTHDILLWNLEHNIKMYRVTSTLLPLATHPDILKDYEWRWQNDDDILKWMNKIKKIVKTNSIRLTMHPDQFTVINSNKMEVVKNSIDYLKYHSELLEHLGGSDMIIHTGGIYGNKEEAKKRFIETYNNLEEGIKKYLRLENDDKSYNLEEVLEIYEKTKIPIVLDIHHNKCHHINPINKQMIKQVFSSWKNTNLIPKMHISSGREFDEDRRHHDYINYEDLMCLEALLGQYEIDLMVEAKKKEYATLKVMDYLKAEEKNL